MAKTPINALPPGTVLHGEKYDYEIERTLGQGSFGITYLASVKTSGGNDCVDAIVHVAIKEFFMHDVNGRYGTAVTAGNMTGLFERYKAKFIGEAANLSKFDTPNIIKVIELFHANETVYYSMEYIAGGSLDETIAKHGVISEPTTLELSKQIGQALSLMHSRNMLHLDLKPSNIMMRDAQSPVLIDFGLSKQYEDNGDPESSTTIGAGTPGYAPIEQSNYTGQHDGHIPCTMDIYALGATMFKMLTGHHPPEASIIVNDGFPTEELTVQHVSSKTLQLIRKAMCPIKKNRFQTVEEMLQTIESEDDGDKPINEQQPGSEITVIKTNAPTQQTIENLIAGGRYKDAYNLCLSCLNAQENVSYAEQKCKELIPIMKQIQKKENRRNTIIIILATVLVTVIAILIRI